MKSFTMGKYIESLRGYCFSICLLLLLSNSTALHAQKKGQALLDSLLTELPKAKEDTNKVKLLVDISYNYNDINSEKDIIYGDIGLQLAEKLNWKIGVATCNMRQGKNYFFRLKNYSKALTSFLNAYYILKEIKYFNQLVESIRLIVHCFITQFENNKALEFVNNEIKFVEKFGNTLNLSFVLCYVGDIYKNQEACQAKAMEYYFKALNELDKSHQIVNDKEMSFYSAYLFNEIGGMYKNQGNYPKALEYYLKALDKSERSGWKEENCNISKSIGDLYLDQKNYSLSLNYYVNCLKISEEIGNKDKIATAYGDIGWMYVKQKNNTKALEFCLQALKLQEELGENTSSVINSIGVIYLNQKHYLEALDFFSKSLKKSDANDSYLSTYNTMNIGNVYIGMFKDSICNKSIKKQWLLTAISKFDSSSIVFKKIGMLNEYQESLGYLAEAYELNEQYDKALITFKEQTIYKDSLFNQEKDKEINRKELDYTYSKREDSMRLETDKKELQLKKELELQQLRNSYAQKQAAAKSQQEKQQLRYEEEIKRTQITSNYEREQAALEAKHNQQTALAKATQEKKDALNAAIISNQKAMTRASLVGAALLMLVALVSINAYRQKRKANNLITQEKQRSENLLLNILPEEIAEELNEKVSAAAKHFEEVTVLFTDFVNFTQHSERLSPTELVAELNSCFTAFDEIIERNGLEKIKTIGDAYMAVCGLPAHDADHAAKTVRAAIEIRDYIVARNKAHGEEGFAIRIGLHSGSVVAGIIGVKKFAYDIWGDTVNFASRMESSGEQGKVNISESTYQLVCNQFAFEHRGKIKAKNKGEVDMYFVELEKNN